MQPLETWGFIFLFEKLGMKLVLALYCPLLAYSRNLNKVVKKMLRKTDSSVF